MFHRSRAELAAAVEWIAERYEGGATVLVHCAFGRGRSATVTAAALLRLGLATSADDAVARVRAARFIRVKGAQRAALERYAARLAAR